MSEKEASVSVVNCILFVFMWFVNVCRFYCIWCVGGTLVDVLVFSIMCSELLIMSADLYGHQCVSTRVLSVGSRTL